MAKGFIAQFLVNVTSKNMGKTVRDTEALGATVDRVAQANNRADKSSKNFFNTQEKGVIGTANGTKSFSKMAETIGGGGSTSLVGVYATLAANVFAVTAAFNALRGAAQVEQVLRGLDAAGARVGLTLSITTRDVQNLAQGMLTAEQAARSTAQFMAGGFKTDQLKDMTVLARDVSIALGRNMTDSMDRLTRGVLKLEPELLDELGIMTKLGDATSMYAQELQKPVGALTQFERRQAFMNAVLTEGQLKFGGLAESAGDTTVYDRLSATFSNLTKDVFGFINNGLGGLIGAIADSKAALVGMIVLFASSIKGQLLPMFNDLGRAAQLQSQILSRQSVSIVAAFGDSLEDTSHDASLWARSVEKGTATMSDYRIAMKSVNADIKDHVHVLKEAGRATDANSVAARRSMQQELAALRDIRTEMKNYERLQYRATGQQLVSQGIGLGGQGQFKAGWKDMMEGFTMLNNSIDPAAGKMERFSASLSKAGNMAKFFGASLLYALPYIGMLVAVGGMLYSWLTKQTEAQQKLNKAYEDFSEITDTVTKKVAEYNRMQESTASAAARVEAMTKLRAQAINELSDAYDKLKTAQAEVEKQNEREVIQSQATALRRQSELSMLSDTGTGKEQLARARQLEGIIEVAEKAGISVNSMALKIAAGNEGVSVSLLQLTDSMERLDSEGFKRLLKSYGLMDKNNKVISVSNDVLSQSMERISKELKTNNNDAQLAIEGTTGAFKNLEDAMGAFILASVPSTPYDKIVDGFNSASQAVNQLTLEFERGKISANDYYATLTAIGSRTGTVMSVEMQNAIKDFRLLDSRLQTERQALKVETDPDKVAGSTARIADLEKQVASRAQEAGVATARQLQEARKVALVLQEQTRTLDAQMQRLEAQRKTYQSIYQINGQGLLEQFAHEEKMRGMQIERLKHQMSYHKGLIATAEQEITLLEISKENTLEDQKQLLIQKKKFDLFVLQDQYQRAQQRARDKNSDETLEFARITSQANILADMGRFEKELAENTRFANQQIDIQIAGIRNNIEGSKQALQALQDQVAAIGEENLSNRQKIALAAEKDYQVTQKYVTLLKTQADLLASIEETHSKIRSISAGETDNLLVQYRQIQKNSQVERARILTDAANNARRIEVEKEVLSANKARADANNDATKAAELGLANLERELDAEEQLTQLRLNQVSATELLKSLELAMFDTRKEGLEWQKQAYEYQQKSLDSAKELASQQLKNNQLRRQNARLSSNLPITSEFTATEEIETKRQAYQFALAELKVRDAMIDLEYALLDAQKSMLQEELSARRALLLETTELTEESPRIKQLTEAITGLSRTNISELGNRAKDVIREQAETLRLELERSSINANSYVSDFMKPFMALQDTFRLQEERARAALAANKNIPGRKDTAAIIADNAIPIKEELTKVNTALKQPLPVMVEVRNHLAEVAKNTADLVRFAGGEVHAPQLEGDIYQRLSTFKSWVEKTFPGVHGELDNHGGKTGDRRGIDFNFGSGNVEWNNEQQRAIMDQIAAAAIRAGLGTLWGPEGSKYNERRVGGHLDHLHIDTVRDTARSAAATEENTKAINQTLSRPLEVKITNTKELEPYKTPEYSGNRIPNASMGESPIGGSVDYDSLISAVDSSQPIFRSFKDNLDLVALSSLGFVESLKELGPQGEAVASLSAGMFQISYAFDYAFKQFKTGDLNSQIMGTIAIASSALSTISSVYASASQAKIDAIDAEIAAEQRRDGKSAESLAKLQSLEKRKEASAKKAFNTNKKLMMAQAAMSTAAAVTAALVGPPGPPWSFVIAGITAALGAAQLGIISGTSYQGGNTNASANISAPGELNIGKRGDTVDLARNNPNPGGEIGYLRGTPGYGKNAADYQVIGSAYGGPLPRGYGNTAFAVGEHGPEVLTPDNPITVRPLDKSDNQQALPPVNFNIQALDAKGVDELIRERRGDIIGMLREAANASGEPFMEGVNTNVYTSPNVGRL